MKTRVVLGIVLALLVDSLEAQNAKPPTIKEIMAKLNKGPNSLCPSIGKDLRADEPKWNDIQKEAKAFAGFAEELPKLKPPRGDKANWDKLAKTFADNAKALDEAAQKKDKEAAQAVHKRLADMKNCNACHDAHRNP